MRTNVPASHATAHVAAVLATFGRLQAPRLVAKKKATAAAEIAAARSALRLSVSEAAPYRAMSELNVPACTIW
jgi:hypothetical protein